MTNKLNTPTRPDFVSAESEPLPELWAFERFLAGVIQVDDLLLVHGDIYRVKARTTYYTTPHITFVVWPCAGGQPRRFDCLPAQIVQAVTFDTDEQTRPMSPIVDQT